MGLFDMFRAKDINEETAKAREIEGSVIIDVRTSSEYNGGHIPNSINIPVDEISRSLTKFTDKSTPFFIYCLSGARSASAAKIMNNMGYENVTDMGGITRYRGELEK